MHRYTRDMPYDQRMARHVRDMAAQVFQGRDRHALRVALRTLHNLPPLHADKVLRDQALEAERQDREALVDKAMLAHDVALTLSDSGHADPDHLQALAEAALRRLADAGHIDDAVVQMFRDAEPRYVVAWREDSPAALPPLMTLAHALCKAAIGQAFIDARIAMPEGAQAGVVITPETLDAWFYN